MQNLSIQLDAAFNKVTELTCRKIINNIRTVEDKFWNEDLIFEQNNREEG